MKVKMTAIALTSLALITALIGGTAGATTDRPSNDDFAVAAAIENSRFSEERDLSGATLERGEMLPSCGALKGSVWYRFKAPDTKVYAAWFQASFDAGIAAYRIAESGLQEVSCSPAGSLGGVELDAQAGDSFYIQVGNTRRKQGILEFKFSLARWQEETLHEISYTRQSEEQRVELLSVRGAPRASDPSIYDVEIGISQQTPIKRGILTFGVVQERIEAELIRIPASTTTVDMSVVARYDSTQPRCLTDEGDGSDCTAHAPLSDPGTFVSEDGMGSHVAIRVVATRNGDVLVEQTLLIPFAGQVAGTP